MSTFQAEVALMTALQNTKAARTRQLRDDPLSAWRRADLQQSRAWANAPENDSHTNNPTLAKISHETKKEAETLPPKFREIGEVRGLGDDPMNDVSTTGFARISEMKRKRLERHSTAIAAFEDRVRGKSEDLDEATRSLALRLKEDLGNSEAEMNALMSQLEEPGIGSLTLEELYTLWETVESFTPRRVARARAFGGALDDLEGERKQFVEKEMKALVPVLVEVAHMLPGDIERLLAARAHQTNLEIVHNRQLAVDFVSRVHVDEIERERSQRKHFEESFEVWRRLHHEHAIGVFKFEMETERFTSPPERRALINEMNQAGKELHQKLLVQMHVMNEIEPPDISTKSGGTFDDASVAVLNLLDEAESMQKHYFDLLNQQAADMGVQCEQQVSVLRAELHACEDKTVTRGEARSTPEGGNTDGNESAVDVVQKVVDDVCTPLVKKRRDMADAVINRVVELTTTQALATRKHVEAFVAHVQSACSLWEKHSQEVRKSEDDTRVLQDVLRSEHVEKTDRKEDDLGAVINGMREASDHPSLMASQAAANALLVDIETMHRAFRNGASEIAQAHTANVKDKLKQYRLAVLSFFHVREDGDVEAEQTPEDPQQQAEEKDDKRRGRKADGQRRGRAGSKGEKDKGKVIAKGNGKRATRSREKKRADKAEAVASPPPPVDEIEDVTVLTVPAFKLQGSSKDNKEKEDETYVKYWILTEPPQNSEEDVGSDDDVKVDDKDTAATKRNSKKTAPDTKTKGRRGNSRGNKSLSKSGSKDREVAVPRKGRGRSNSRARSHKSEESDDQGPLETLEQTLNPEELASIDPGVEVIPAPEPIIIFLKRRLRRGFIEHMQEWLVAVADRAARELDSLEDELTNELDATLRAHQPRQGRMEFDQHHVRGVELRENRKKLDRHLRQMNARVKDAGTSISDDVVQMTSAALSRFISHIGARRKALNSMNSVVSLESVGREITAALSNYLLELAANVDDVKHRFDNHASTTAQLNLQFGQQMRTFAEPIPGTGHHGTFNPEEVKVYRARLHELDAHAEHQYSVLARSVDAMAADHQRTARDAVEAFENEVKAHLEDQTFIERASLAIGSTNMNIRAEMAGSTQSLAAVEALIGKLKAALLGGSAQHTLEEREKWKTVTTTAPVPVKDMAADGIAGAAELLTQIYEVCKEFSSQAAFLDCLQVSLPALDDQVVDLIKKFTSLDSTDLSNAGASTLEERPAAEVPLSKGRSAPKGDSKAKVAPGRLKQGKKSSGKGSVRSFESSPNVPPGVVAPLYFMERIEGFLENGREDVSQLAVEYYREKGMRDATRPEKIPPTCEEFLEQLDVTLESFMAQSTSFLTEKIEEFRAYVASFSTLITSSKTCLPSAIFNNIATIVVVEGAEQLGALHAEFASSSAKWEEEKQAHRRALGPRLGHPNNRGVLEQLASAEDARMVTVMEAIASTTAALQECEVSRGHIFLRRLRGTTRLLLELLDACVLADALVPAPESGTKKRRSLRKRLKDKAAANASKSSQKVAADVGDNSGKDHGGKSRDVKQSSKLEGRMLNRSKSGDIPGKEDRLRSKSSSRVDASGGRVRAARATRTWPQLPDDNDSLAIATRPSPVADVAEVEKPEVKSGRGSRTSTGSDRRKAPASRKAKHSKSESRVASPRPPPDVFTSAETPEHAAVVRDCEKVYQEFVGVFERNIQELTAQGQAQEAALEQWKETWLRSVSEVAGLSSLP